MNGLQTQMKLHDALRYLKERGKYCLDQRVEKQEPQLTQWQQWVKEVYGRATVVANEGSRA